MNIKEIEQKMVKKIRHHKEKAIEIDNKRIQMLREHLYREK